MDIQPLIYDFDPDKNAKLKKERGISFEEIIEAIEDGLLLDVQKHHNTQLYAHQKIYVVGIEGYAYLVPFVEDKDGHAFLKTIIPCRKATKKYLG